MGYVELQLGRDLQSREVLQLFKFRILHHYHVGRFEIHFICALTCLAEHVKELNVVRSRSISCYVVGGLSGDTLPGRQGWDSEVVNNQYPFQMIVACLSSGERQDAGIQLPYFDPIS